MKHLRSDGNYKNHNIVLLGSIAAGGQEVSCRCRVEGGHLEGRKMFTYRGTRMVNLRALGKKRHNGETNSMGL